MNMMKAARKVSMVSTCCQKGACVLRPRYVAI